MRENFITHIRRGISTLADYDTKLQFQKLLFPDGLNFDGTKRTFLTKKVNDFYSVTHSISVNYRSENKKGRCAKNANVPVVERSPDISNFNEDIELIETFMNHVKKPKS